MERLVQITTVRGKGGASSTQQAVEWRKQRKEVGNTVQPRTPNVSESWKTYLPSLPSTVADSTNGVSALARLQGRKINILTTWRSELEQSSGSVGTQHELRFPAEELPPARRQEQAALSDPNSTSLAAANDKIRPASSLPLQERLFLFYKDHCRAMMRQVPEIAHYWSRDETHLDSVLHHRYKENLTSTGLSARDSTLVDMVALEQDMRRAGVEMTPAVVPSPDWAPQHAYPLCMSPLRDAVLLSEIDVSRPATAADIEARSAFQRAVAAVAAVAAEPKPLPPLQERSTTRFPPASPPSEGRDASAGARGSAGCWSVPLSLKEHVWGLVPPAAAGQVDSPPGSSHGSLSQRSTLPATPGGPSRRSTPLAPAAAAGAEQDRPAAARRPKTMQAGRAGGPRGLDPVAELSRPYTSQGLSGPAPAVAWQEKWSVTHAAAYWYNPATGVSQWQPPSPQPAAEVDKEESDASEGTDVPCEESGRRSGRARGSELVQALSEPAARQASSGPAEDGQATVDAGTDGSAEEGGGGAARDEVGAAADGGAAVRADPGPGMRLGVAASRNTSGEGGGLAWGRGVALARARRRSG